jgi:hypothetical protein
LRAQVPSKRIASARPLSHAALLRRIAARKDALIAALGPLSAADKAAIVQGFRAPHCEVCTARCQGCLLRNKTATLGPCPAVHTCGSASQEQLDNEQCCLLAHARRPCVRS